MCLPLAYATQTSGSSMCRILDLMKKGRGEVSDDQPSELFEIFVLHTWSIQCSRWALYRHEDIWAGIQNLVVKLEIIKLLYNMHVSYTAMTYSLCTNSWMNSLCYTGSLDCYTWSYFRSRTSVIEIYRYNIVRIIYCCNKTYVLDTGKSLFFDEYSCATDNEHLFVFDKHNDLIICLYRFLNVIYLLIHRSLYITTIIISNEHYYFP